jgi:hypothetical protein
VLPFVPKLFVGAIALAPLALLVPLIIWARWLRRRAGIPPFARKTGYGFLALAMSLTAYAVVRVPFDLGSLAQAHTADKARILGSAIAEAMYDDVLTFAVAAVMALWLLFCTWRWFWAAKPVTVKGDPPYR